MGNVIELQHVEKVYPGAVDTQVLFDVNLGFQEGSFNSIVGQSGSGKSTLLNIIGTLDQPTRGEVFIDGARTTAMNRDGLAGLRNRTIGFVFQFHYLLPEFTAVENVLMPYLIGKREPPEAVRQRADKLFEMMGIAAVKNNLSTRMSGGQQQRTAIARALVNNPKVVLADEPTGNLDTENSNMIYSIFRDINKQYSTTFIIVTHDRRIAEQADRIVEIRDGRLVLDITR